VKFPDISATATRYTINVSKICLHKAHDEQQNHYGDKGPQQSTKLVYKLHALPVTKSVVLKHRRTCM